MQKGPRSHFNLWVVAYGYHWTTDCLDEQFSGNCCDPLPPRTNAGASLLWTACATPAWLCRGRLGRESSWSTAVALMRIRLGSVAELCGERPGEASALRG
ncbi:hypothetical protein Drorol1_Dr00000267 [Drosera rotundifolia]